MLRKEEIERRMAFVREKAGGPIETLDDVAWAQIKTIEAVYEKVAGFHWDITFTDRVSNTHAAPLNGETNWGGRKKDAPRGYPGFSGRVWIRFFEESDRSMWAHSAFGRALAHPGTGGGGAYDGPWERIAHEYYKALEITKNSYKRPIIYSWDFRFFLADWPEIGREIEENIIMCRLKGREIDPIKHSFKWDHPAWIESDKIFIERCEQYKNPS